MRKCYILPQMGRQISESFSSAKNHSARSQNDAHSHQMNRHSKGSGEKKGVFKIYALHSLFIEMLTFCQKEENPHYYTFNIANVCTLKQFHNIQFLIIIFAG